jgi:hypothetical protein
MPRYRSDSRTIMFVIAAGTPLMRVLRHWPALSSRVKGSVILAVIAAFFLVALVIEFAAFATYLSRGRTRPRQVLGMANRPIRRLEPDQSGASQRV